MSVNMPLFYRSVVPLNPGRHLELRISQTSNPLDFARTANLIPALVDEFDLALGVLPIAFLPGIDKHTAVFVTGAAPGTNAFISDDGLWTGAYVPAYLRRYPFIIGDVDENESVLCIDEEYEGFNDASGERLFSDAGDHTGALKRALILAESYRDAAVRTETYCAMLHELGLLQVASLDTTAPDGTKSVVYGLSIIDEQALAGLDGDKLQKLHQAGFLKAIYCQIASLRAISKLNPAISDDGGTTMKKTA